jgi:transcription antitermination protein NusB
VSTSAERRAADRLPRESRHRAREAALQILYQWEVGKLEMAGVLESFWTEGPPDAVALSADLRAFAAGLANGVAVQVAQLDPMIAEAAQHWRLERMNVLDRLILRLAVYEFLHQPETPGKVVINEALELARTFSGDESVRFINGLLDGIRKSLGRE